MGMKAAQQPWSSVYTADRSRRGSLCDMPGLAQHLNTEEADF